MRSISKADVSGKRVLVRCDFNVPLDKEGNILDDFRIQATIPTLDYLISRGAKVILISHLGDPEGKPVKELKLDSIQLKLLEYLDVSVTKSPSIIGKEVKEWINQMSPGEVLLLENVRFDSREEENDTSFAEELASLGDIYVNNAFATSHRKHASLVKVAELLPAFAGFLLEKEIEQLSQLLLNPKHPMVAIIGGRKIESKLPTINNISKVADVVLLGNILTDEAKEKNISFDNQEKIIFASDGGLDIGPKTTEMFVEKVKEAETVFWAGPLGKFEDEQYAKGSLAVANAIKDKAHSIVGGGETLEFIHKYGLKDRFAYVSTGGGAMLSFLAGDTLPALKTLGYYGDKESN